jgi:iron complex transport system permease protein
LDVREGSVSIYETAQRRLRRRFLLAGLGLLLLFFVFLSLGVTSIRLLSPVQTVRNLWLAIRLALAKVLHWSLYDERLTLIQQSAGYLETMTRLEGGILAMVLGAVLAVSGTVFQCVFRNPIAGPSLLGVSSGVSIGNLLLVLQFSTLATSMTTLRFLYGYGCSLALLGLIFLVGWIAGRGKSSVTEMLLTGCIVSRVATKLVSTIQYYYLDETDYLTLQEMSLYGTGIGNTKGALFLLLALLAGMVPLLLLRNSLNLATFSDEEARCMGLRTGWLRVLGLVCSTILMIAAQIHCGDVGMLAMLVPHLCRYLFGANTKDLVVGSIVLGAWIMLVCRFIIALCAFHPYLSVLSVSTLVSVFAMPLMMLVMLKYRRGWS